jgi:hypothetical protein
MKKKAGSVVASTVLIKYLLIFFRFPKRYSGIEHVPRREWPSAPQCQIQGILDSQTHYNVLDRG